MAGMLEGPSRGKGVASRKYDLKLALRGCAAATHEASSGTTRTTDGFGLRIMNSAEKLICSWKEIGDGVS
jgi:hypothetical protein